MQELYHIQIGTNSVGQCPIFAAQNFPVYGNNALFGRAPAATSLHKADLRFAQSVPESSRGSVVIASLAARPVSPSLLLDDVTPLDSTGGVDKDTSSSPSRGDLVFLMDGVVGSGSPRFRAVWT
jgi:hypothetical protein